VFDPDAATVNLYLNSVGGAVSLQASAAVSAGILNIPSNTGTGAYSVVVTDNAATPNTVDYGLMPFFNLADLQNGSAYGVYVSAPVSLSEATNMPSAFAGTPLCAPFNTDYLVFADTGVTVQTGTSIDSGIIGGLGVFNLLTFASEIESGIFTGTPQALLTAGSNVLVATSDSAAAVFASGGSTTTSIAAPTGHPFSSFNIQTFVDDAGDSIAIGLTGVLMFTTSGTLSYIPYVTPHTASVAGTWVPGYGLVIAGEGAASELLAPGASTFTALPWSSMAIAISITTQTDGDAGTTRFYSEVTSNGWVTVSTDPSTSRTPLPLTQSLPDLSGPFRFVHTYTFGYGDFAIVTGDASGNVNLYWVNPSTANFALAPSDAGADINAADALIDSSDGATNDATTPPPNSQAWTLPANTTDCATPVGTIAFATQGDTIVRWFNGGH
jgi:hypothetical protein